MFNNKKFIQRVLDLYFAGKLKGESSDVVRGWLLSEVDTEEKEEALERLFEEQLDNDTPTHDRYARESLDRLHKEFGFKTGVAAAPGPRKARQSVRSRGFAFGFIVGGSVAAAAIASALILPGLLNRGAEVPPPVTTIVASGFHPEKITLPDGSKVVLKSGTSIVYDEANFTENRTLEIDGEGFFTVAHDPSHPFSVKAGEMTVKALGTEFHVRAPGSDRVAEVALKSGSVEVASGESVLRLKPLQKARVDRTLRMITQQEIGESELMRLRGLRLTLEGVSLDYALAQTGDFFGVTMHIATDLHVTEGIVLSLEDDAILEDALVMLQAVTQAFDFSIEDNNLVTITRK